MSNVISVSQPNDLTPEQISLIKSTVAKRATNDELNLFLYRCKNMGLDPLKPGHIHFVKYGDNPGTIIIGIDGFRSKAAKTGKHTGTKRGVIRDEGGACIGAWCEVYRSDWTQPAREEVSLSEYNTGKAQWSKMPETMIKKVAEVAALRMAFADELGGIYSDDEMDQAKSPPVSPTKGDTDSTEFGDARAKYVESILEKFRKIGVSEKQIRSVCELPDDMPISSLSDDDIRGLNQIGAAIVADKTRLREFFPLQNLAPGGG